MRDDSKDYWLWSLGLLETAHIRSGGSFYPYDWDDWPIFLTGSMSAYLVKRVYETMKERKV